MISFTPSPLRFALCVVVLICPMIPARAGGAPAQRPLASETPAEALAAIMPVDDEHLLMPFPEFRWQAREDTLGDLRAIVEYEIQIASDASFRQLVDQDRLALARYVPSEPLAPGLYYWRVRAVLGEKALGSWSGGRRFSIVPPDERVVVARQPGVSDDTPAIKDAVRKASHLTSEGKTVELVFPAGTYRGSTARNGTFLSLKGMENLIVSGNGSRIELRTYDTSFVGLEDCRDVLVQGFEVHMPDEPPQTQGRVLSVDRETASIVVEFEKGFPTFADAYLREGKGTLRLLDPDIDGRLKTRADTWFLFDAEKSEHLGGRKYRMSMTPPSYRTQKGVVVLSKNLADLLKYFEPGDRFVYSLTSKSSALGFAKHSERITFHEMTDYASVRHYWAFSCTQMHYIRTRSLIPEGGWYNGYADGIHVRGSEIGPWIEEVEIDGIGDDGIALYARPNRLRPQPVARAARELVFYRDEYFDLEPGDAATLYRPTTGEILLETTVESVKEASGQTVAVTFADEIETDLIYHEDWTLADQVWNRSKSCGDFVVRNSRLTNIRRYGTVFRARRGLIENNLYEGVSSSAIIFLNEPQYPNGLYASDIIIRGNTIIDCAFDTMPTRVISFMLKRLGGYEAAESMGSRNILIEDNQIEDCGREPLEFWSTRDVLLRGNTVDGKPLDSISPGLMRNCSGIVFGDAQGE